MRRFEDVVLNQNGQPVPNAQVTVFLAGTSLPAILYSNDGLTLVGNPVTTNNLGVFSFFVASGKYDFRVSGGNISTYTQTNVQVEDIFEFQVTDTQPWQTRTLEFSSLTTGQTPPSGTVNLYSKVSDKNLYYKDDTGREVGPLSGGAGGTPSAPVNSIQKNSAGVFGAALATDNGQTFSINEDVLFQGPNPWADVRAFGKFTTFSSTTASTTSGSPNVTLAAVGNFKNGEYVTIYHAGGACGLATPSIPTVTPSVNGGGVYTLPAAAGSAAFSYTVVAADKFGCYTVASTAGSTFTGNSLGVQTFSISTLTRSNNLVTVNTTAPHSYVTGQLVHIKYFSTTDGSFEGFWLVSSTPTGTSFTFLSGMDTRFGATTSATSGTVLGFNANFISWTAVPGAWKYYIYGRTGGTFTLLGQTLLNNYVDYGSPMNDNQTFPTYIPTTAPVAGANAHLTARVSSGGGTTTLTLASSAGASVSGPILSDDGPALVAAAQSASTVYVPSQGLNINSYTICPAARYYKLGGSIQASDTVESSGGSIWEAVAVGNGGAAAGWSNVARVAGTAYPQFVLGNTDVFNKIQFNCTANNGCLNMVDSLNATECSFEYVQFVTGSGNPFDYIGMNQLFKGGGFAFRYNKCLFTTGSPGPNDNTNIGNSPIPSVQFMPREDSITTNNTYITSAWFTQRGSINVAAGLGGIGWFIAKDIEGQSCSLPYFQFSRSQQFGGGVRGGVDLENLLGADRATAFVANYHSNNYPDVWIKKAVSGTGGRGIFTGLPFVITSTGAGNIGQNTNVLNLGSYNLGAYLSPSITTDNVIQASSLGFPMATPSTAPVVVVSAGGGANVGTFPFVVQFLDANGFYGPQSPAVTATVSPGNQTVNITRPTAPVGAVSWVPFANGGAIPCVPVPTSTITYLWNSSLCSGSNPPPSANATSIGAVGVSTPTLSFWNNGFTTTTDFPNLLTANQNLHVPNVTGTLTLKELAQTWTASQTFQGNIFSTGTAFASLGTPANGALVYCSDCTITSPCAGGGTGAFAKRLSATWVCN